MIIRELKATEVPAIARIEEKCFSNPWSKDSIKSSFANKANRFYVAEKDGVIVGYMGLSISVDEGYILNVATLPEYRRQGIAKALINHIINMYSEKLKFITLEVRPSNTAALKLYEGFGFEQVGERKNYYSNPAENAVLLTLFFSKENI
ncbi:MAG: ribosomal protein S18-alanine N-acetyltransferase [Clostridia bacterium]|nr:ribosomal protein S18-alanine N-acetyltransferase [Ruminococcus sp.]MBR0089231.1 ribosomal protein S18-alanine N-acetyltransferase [Clostridia bacterium]